MTTITRLDILRNLVASLRDLVTADDHHRAYVSSAINSPADALDELDGAMALAIEQNDEKAIPIFCGIRGTIGRGTFPPGVWADTIAVCSFAYSNTYYCDLATRERAGTCLDWGTF